ncbi:hypothetical protein N7447_009710 [Penicillium robsamsonii]|uniref:uncharacterized protein n=1 Tax=Penicillium robsamsonii TaxID=1792511 RepID=UPI002547DCC2|nr:uncharacterized protein N7447_009710 [Penicillium robsamsonii]KAJ5817477.1 hypothetical protein N7447_009710 [Penicillium robsamsonii]
MLRRVKKLRSFFQPFCEEYDYKEMLLNNQEWRQIDYLLQITRPFFNYTTELSKTKEVTTHLIFKLYNALFNHFFEAEALLKRKRVPWKSDILKALTAGRLKLDDAGVERLFNTARDVYHYRRGRLRSETIEELMLFLCATRFNLKEAEAKQLQQFFSLAELESLKEELNDHTEDAELDLISDNEEEEEEEGI